MPRIKGDFTKDAIKGWLASHGLELEAPETPSFPEKDYSDPAEVSSDHGDYDDDDEHD